MNDLTHENVTTGGTIHKSEWSNREFSTILQSESIEMKTVAGPLVVAGYLLVLVAMTVIVFVG